MEKSFSIRIETAEKEEINEIMPELEKSFCIEGSVRSYQKRNHSGWLHYLKIKKKGNKITFEEKIRKSSAFTVTEKMRLIILLKKDDEERKRLLSEFEQVEQRINSEIEKGRKG